MLLGILKKEDVIAELSDMARTENVKIDKFITNLAKKLTFEEVVPYCKLKEFPTVNIFGELQGKWSRIQLMSMCEGVVASKERNIEAEETQSEEQVMEWMIFLVLEHMPRPLYAVNKQGKTVFYNSLFEDSYKANLNKDVSTAYVEKTLKNADKNEIISSKSAAAIRFYNKDLKMHYERIPMKSSGDTVGYLIFFDSKISEQDDFVISGMDISGMTLPAILDAVERQVLITALRKESDLQKAAKSLSITKQILCTKIKKYKIDLKKIN
jgi:transcriptional regulator with PAS, ATPase and Fis domain